MPASVDCRAADSDLAARGVARRRVSLLLKQLAFTLLFLSSAVAIHWLARSGLYTSGDDVGYNLGLLGSLMLLTLLLYPLRKRVRWLDRMGRISRWFSVHMMLGIAGPVLILLHCTLRWSSLNAAVAFWCMVIVASSGVVGRFLYRRLHVGLYGRQLSLADVRTDAALQFNRAKEQLQLPPLAGIHAELLRFCASAGIVSNAGWKRPLALMSLGMRARLAQGRCLRLARAAEKAAGTPALDAADAATSYFQAARRSAQFLPFERMFLLWHVLHVPLVFIMVLSVIAHIIAVHMY